MKRLRLLLAGAVPLVLAMAGDDCTGLKTGGATGVSIVGASTTININAAAGAAAEGAATSMDPAAGKPGATEIEGTPQHGCLSDGKTCW